MTVFLGRFTAWCPSALASYTEPGPTALEDSPMAMLSNLDLIRQPLFDADQRGA